MSLSLSTSCVPAPTLHFLCGKIGAGKSTLAAELASGPGTMLLSEDRWLAALYPGEILDVADYGRCAARLRNASGTHPYATSEAQFDAITAYFVEPGEDEGFDIVRHAPAGGERAGLL